MPEKYKTNCYLNVLQIEHCKAPLALHRETSCSTENKRFFS